MDGRLEDALDMAQQMRTQGEEAGTSESAEEGAGFNELQSSSIFNAETWTILSVGFMLLPGMER